MTSSTEKAPPQMLQPDCRNKARGVWLVKVPKYLSKRWREQAGSPEVGRLRVSKMKTPTKDKTQEVIFSSSEDSIGSTSSITQQSLQNSGQKRKNEPSKDSDLSQEPLPKEHRFVVSSLYNQTLIVMSEDVLTQDDIDDEKTPSVNVEGRVVQRAECKPLEDDKVYNSFKRLQFDAVARPTSQAQTIEKAEIKFKPVSRHAEHIAAEKAKKDNKNVRLDKEVVQDLLFQAFEKHQYYKLVDLSRVTAQPPNYLKEILQEIAVYNTMPPHKYTWELKPQYRHYKGQEQDGDGESSTTAA